jgi:hypothetical protein
LLTKIRLEATQKALYVYESIVNEATEYKEIEVEGNEKI